MTTLEKLARSRTRGTKKTKKCLDKSKEVSYNLITRKEGHDLKRFIRTSKYLNESSNKILFDDQILVKIDVILPKCVAASRQDGIAVYFPGTDQFRKDVAEILEREYGFEVIEDMHDGKLQKGYVSNRDDSISVYFDTYLDLCSAQRIVDKSEYTQLTCPDFPAKMFCFIHLRFSDHDIPDLGDVAHRRFIAQNAEKYTKNNPEITHVVDEDSIVLSEQDVYRYYDDAIDDLRANIETRIRYWIRKADRYKRRN